MKRCQRKQRRPSRAQYAAKSSQLWSSSSTPQTVLERRTQPWERTGRVCRSRTDKEQVRSVHVCEGSLAEALRVTQYWWVRRWHVQLFPGTRTYYHTYKFSVNATPAAALQFQIKSKYLFFPLGAIQLTIKGSEKSETELTRD